MVAPQVVALRTARMLTAGINPSARDRRELERMGTEKVLAFWESMNAMGLEMAKAQQQYALVAMRQWWSPLGQPMVGCGGERDQSTGERLGAGAPARICECPPAAQASSSLS